MREGVHELIYLKWMLRASIRKLLYLPPPAGSKNELMSKAMQAKWMAKDRVDWNWEQRAMERQKRYMEEVEGIDVELLLRGPTQEIDLEELREEQKQEKKERPKTVCEICLTENGPVLQMTCCQKRSVCPDCWTHHCNHR